MASDIPGTVYLLHLDPPYKHARHYLGWAANLTARLAEHEQGHGARLLAVQKAAGGTWHLSRTWTGATRTDERRIKNTGHVPHYCPDCQPQRSADRRAGRHTDVRTAAGARYDAAVRAVWAEIPADTGTRQAWAQARPGMVAAQRQLDADLAAIRGRETATKTPAATAAATAAGKDTTTMTDYQDELGAEDLFWAEPPPGAEPEGYTAEPEQEAETWQRTTELTPNQLYWLLSQRHNLTDAEIQQLHRDASLNGSATGHGLSVAYSEDRNSYQVTEAAADAVVASTRTETERDYASQYALAGDRLLQEAEAAADNAEAAAAAHLGPDEGGFGHAPAGDAEAGAQNAAVRAREAGS